MNKNAFKVIPLVIMMILGLLSCKKDKQDDTALADVYVKTISVIGETAFGLEHVVRGNAQMNAVTVSIPGGLTAQLIAYDESKLLYYLEPSLGNGTYTRTPPIAGTYSYRVTFSDGVEKVFTDVLGSGYLPPANITSIAKTSDGLNVQISFDALTGVDYFQISIYLADILEYTSPLQTPPAGNNFAIPLSTIPSFTPGTYTYHLDAIKYQSLDLGTLQAISTATADIAL
jgi:hypothetical protein